MKFIIPLLLALLAVGCRSHPKCGAELYQSYYASATDDYLILKLLDQGKTHTAEEYAVSSLEGSLSELRVFIKQADETDLIRQSLMTSRVLKYATEHQAKLSTNRFALRMVTQLKAMLTDPSDIRRASDLIGYLQTTGTNQLPVWND
jgi:hypothetical protein